MKYLIVIETTGFNAYSPDLPVCVATGQTRIEVKKYMQSAIAFYFEGMR